MGFLQNLIITIIVIIALIAIYSLFSKNPEKYYKLASKSHKKGEKYHLLGDSELSKEYYEESEHYRKKAEELKNVV
jgi:hypothetical protein|tara:strand:+ start:744 stop:971 length:228 start_codon:yes stop_codon:yes gene_type:complete